LSDNSSGICSVENNQGWQRKIKQNKQIINEEKDRRKKLNNLQNQIGFLQNQSNNSDNEEKIKELQRQIDELKKNKPVIPPVPNPKIPHQPVSSLPKKDNGNFLIGVFFLGFGVCLVLVVVFLVLAKKKKKTRGV
jgi:hypothetical protein